MRLRTIATLLVSASLGGCGRSALTPETFGLPGPVHHPESLRVGDPRREDISLWDAFQTELPSLTGSARQERVDRLWADLGDAGAPLHGGNRIAFLLRDGSEGWTVAGSFNGWDPAATPLTRIAGTDTLYAEVTVPSAARVSYKLVRAGSWTRDPAARWVEWDGIDTGTVGNFNSVTFSAAGAALAPSELYLLAGFHSIALENDRDVFVQVPDSYFPSEPALPLLVMHDGNESLCRGRFETLLDSARLAGGPDFLVAYVALHDQAERMDEYTFGTPGSKGLLYESFIADELVPAVEERFATPRTPETRGVMGASLGGLISWRIGFDRPDVFLRTAGQSSSFFWNSNQIIGELQASGLRPGRWYLDAGDDADNGTEAAMMRDALQANGYDFDYVRQEGGQHDWSYWGMRLPGAVGYLFAP
jgi:enterochelin esterase-like enzyme